MDGSPPSPKESTPIPSSSSTSPSPTSDEAAPVGELPLSVDEFKKEVKRRVDAAKLRDAQEHADAIRWRCRTFHGFVKEAWPLLEPEARFSDNWHVELICKHLEAVTFGLITRLLINVWPGSMKSMLVSVLWQAWEWGPMGRRSLRYLSTAFNETPTTRDTRKCRDLIMSEWYQTLWPDVVLKRWAEKSFANTDTGSRLGIPFTSLTSQRGDRLIIDDPLSQDDAEYEKKRKRVERKFREGAVNRLNDQLKSAIVVIMQRLHMDDLSGIIERHYPEFVHVVLPMEFEKGRAYRAKDAKWGSDPRTIEGDLADEKRFPPQSVNELKQSGDYFWAGQYQQRPAPREGGMFKVDKITIIEAKDLPIGGRLKTGWDFGATNSPSAAKSVRVKGKRVRGNCYITHVERRSTDPFQLEEMITEVLVDDGLQVRHSFPQDPGGAGKGQKWRVAELAAGYDFVVTPEKGDKEVRARPFAAQVGAGRVFLLRGPWNEDYIEELRNFPTGSFKDQVDASSRWFEELLKEPAVQTSPGPEIVDPEEMAIERARGLLDEDEDYDPWAARTG